MTFSSCNVFCLLLLSADKQDDENQNLKSQLKDSEEESTKLQRKISVQQSQTEKYKMLSQAASKKCEGLQQEVVALKKVLQILVSFISQWKKISRYSLQTSSADLYPSIPFTFRSLITVLEMVF